jgi:hypothetical protein
MAFMPFVPSRICYILALTQAALCRASRICAFLHSCIPAFLHSCIPAFLHSRISVIRPSSLPFVHFLRPDSSPRPDASWRRTGRTGYGVVVAVPVVVAVVVVPVVTVVVVVVVRAPAVAPGAAPPRIVMLEPASVVCCDRSSSTSAFR